MVNFKLTKWKVVVSLLVIILIYLYAQFINLPVCEVCEIGVECSNYEHLAPFEKCSCKLCTPIIEVIFEWFLFVIFPGILVYVIWSFFDKKP